jgi:hypothetical protein
MIALGYGLPILLSGVSLLAPWSFGIGAVWVTLTPALLLPYLVVGGI